MSQDPGPKVIPVTKDGREGVQVVGRSATGRVTLDVTDGLVHGLPAAPAGSTSFVGVLEGGSIRAWWDGGADPTASAGVLIQAGDTLTLVTAADIAAFRGIQVSGTAVLQGHYA